jgi:hypothetical protein
VSSKIIRSQAGQNSFSFSGTAASTAKRVKLSNSSGLKLLDSSSSSSIEAACSLATTSLTSEAQSTMEMNSAQPSVVRHGHRTPDGSTSERALLKAARSNSTAQLRCIS